LTVPKVERTVTTSATPEQVWAFMSDFTTTEQWDPPTRSTCRVSGHGGVGTVYRNVSRILGSDTEIEYTVVECEPPTLLRLHGRTSSMDMTDTIEVAPHPSGAQVRYTAEFRPQGLAKLAEPLLPLGLKKLGDDAAGQMKTCLDGLAH
jgi:carbon monoxide dehydrogenase subunit G